MRRHADSPDGERDLQAEFREPAAGHVGVPFDAICTGCRQNRVKRAEEDPEDPKSFKHICENCQKVTWWNPIRTLTELLPEGDQR
jgi:hypothetical protein